MWFSSSLLLALVLFQPSWLRGQLAGQKNQPSRVVSRKSAEYHLAQGYAALRNNRYHEAENEFRAALALNPRLVLRARFPLAVALFQAHNLTQARREFEAVRQSVGDQPNVMYYLGRLDLMEGNADAAIRALTRAATKPPFPDTAYYLGYAYLNKGELAPAEKWLSKAVQLVPNDPAVRYRLGILYRREGRNKEARESFALSEKLRNEQVEQDRLRLQCLQKLKESTLAEARPVCEQLDDPHDAAKLTILGTIYGEHGDYEDALKPLRRAAELMPHSPQMEYNLALCYFHLKQFEKAREPLAEATKRWPDLYNINALYGLVLLHLGQNRAAYNALRHAHNLDPQDAEITHLLFQLSLALAEQSRKTKQYAAALKFLKEAAQIFPKDPEPLQRMANVYLQTGHPNLAAQAQREASRLSSQADAH